MLNEAEASRDEKWARETRQATTIWHLWLVQDRGPSFSLVLTVVVAFTTMNTIPDLYSGGTQLWSHVTLLLLAALFLAGLLIFLLRDSNLSLLYSWAIFTGLMFLFEPKGLAGDLRLGLFGLMLLAFALAYFLTRRKGKLL